jgi:23S rRNA (cytosine1962-C5)-methyltransferase
MTANRGGEPPARPHGTTSLPAQNAACLRVIATAGFADYALLDSGHGRKLERFGRFVVDRPEPQAMWQPVLEPGRWLRSDAVFKAGDAALDGESGRWLRNKPLPESWAIKVLDVTMLGRLTNFRHLGLFPEQLPHWEWVLGRLGEVRGETPRVLNLFAYTGAASLIAAKENQAVSKLGEAPIRWILEDARKFVAREVRRGKRYHVILVDPPKFGRGPGGEVWDVFVHLAPLLRDCALLLAASQSALVLTTYAIRASALAMDALVRESVVGRTGDVESGELAVIEEGAGRLLPTSLFTRWTARDDRA